MTLRDPVTEANRAYRMTETIKRIRSLMDRHYGVADNTDWLIDDIRSIIQRLS